MPGQRATDRQSSLLLSLAPTAKVRHRFSRLGSTWRRGTDYGFGKVWRQAPVIREDRDSSDEYGTAYRFGTLAENLSDAVLIYDRQLRCRYANPAVEACLDRTPDQFVGKSSTGPGFPRKLTTLWNDTLALMFASGQSLTQEFRLSTRGGDRHLEMRVFPDVDLNRGVENALLIIRDISERREAKKERQRTMEILQQRDAELEEFAYVASHDLKGPLRNAHALSSWIEEEIGGNLSDEGVHHMQLMRARLQRMDELINATLEFSRAGHAAGGTHDISPFELAGQIANQQGLPESFRFSASPTMPRIRTNQTLFTQVLTHLIGNAVEHHDRADGHVWMSCRDLHGFWEFSVVDDGPGIPTEYHQHIFHMFQRGPVPQHHNGYGIGLAIVKKVVERVGGHIEVDSAPGWGTTFRFTWPKTH
ncbi:PAS domain-containing sensor histidine kinase [Thiohalomonas denitrificans]|uniref:PAS domain-containing sensor histidine kinase n=1 Tax=Thiohalomonas denitrificans TaxID=415747 RepID=UPI0026EABA70|nr:PAS domain-containing sensor histidine kinase [Thiohalomonas denitrificans]